MSKVHLAVNCFRSGLNCSQAILSTYCEEYGLDKRTALKLACGFGGGMGRLGKTCGAVTGAYLVIGLACGNHRKDDNEAKEKTYALVQAFDKAFAERNQSTDCRRLLGFDLLSNVGSKEKERVNRVCPQMVRDAAEILESILNL